MKSLLYILTLLLFLVAGTISQAQEFVPGIICGTESGSNGSSNGHNFNNTIQSFDTRNGRVFSPTGDIRVLVIFAGFRYYDSTNTSGHGIWQINSNDIKSSFPTMVNKSLVNGAYSMDSVFYTNIGQFTNNARDKTISNYFKQMSMGKLNVLGEVYPYYIQVPRSIRSTALVGTEAQDVPVFRAANAFVFNQIISDTTFNLSRYDIRINQPNYVTNNQTTFASPQPDGKADYVVVIYRLPNAYATAISTIPASPTNQKITHGQTIFAGMETGTDAFQDYGFRNIFIHELGHELYGGSHTYGVNGVINNKYSTTRGYSMMNHSYGPSCTNAYERYKLGWADTSTIPYVRFIDSQLDNGTYQLTDFITTGKSICIKVPTNDPAKFQRLWLEYHHKTSIFDERDSYTLNGYGQTIAGTKAGLFAYVEDSQCGLSFSNQHSVSDGNYLKMLSPLGAYDVEQISPPGPWNAWGSIYGYFNKTRDNPLSFSSQQWFRRWHRSTQFITDPDEIETNEHWNGADYRYQEGYYFLSELGTDCWGTGYETAFQPNDEISFSTSSVPASFQQFNYGSDISKQVVLNGVKVKFIGVANGAATVQVTVNDNIISNNQRFTGHAVVPDHLVSSATLPDFELESCKELLLDASEVPNQTRKIQTNKPWYLKDFVGLTQFQLDGNFHIKRDAMMTVREGSALIVNNKLWHNGSMHLSNDASLLLTANSQLELGPRSSLIFEKETFLNFHNSAQLNIHPTAYLKIVDGVTTSAKNPLLKSDYLPSGIPYADYLKSDTDLMNKLGPDNIGLYPSSCTVDGTTTNFCNTTMTFYLRNEKLTSGAWSVVATNPANVSYTQSVSQSGNQVTYNFNNSLSSVTISYSNNLVPFTVTKTFNVNYNKVGNLGGPSCPCEFEPIGCETIELGRRYMPTKPEITNSQTMSSLNIYPNPVQSKSIISLKPSDQLERWILFNQAGKIVAEGQTNEIERGNLLPNGLYFIQVKTANNQFVQKIIFN